jgi:hypothetical protein
MQDQKRPEAQFPWLSVLCCSIVLLRPFQSAVRRFEDIRPEHKAAPSADFLNHCTAFEGVQETVERKGTVSDLISNAPLQSRKTCQTMDQVCLDHSNMHAGGPWG